jgi:hypothetical protein
MIQRSGIAQGGQQTTRGNAGGRTRANTPESRSFVEADALDRSSFEPRGQSHGTASMRAQAAGTIASEARRVEPGQRGYTAIIGRRCARLSSTVTSRTGGKTQCTAHRWPPQCTVSLRACDHDVASQNRQTSRERQRRRRLHNTPLAKSCGVNLPPGVGEYDAHSHENRRLAQAETERSAVQSLEKRCTVAATRARQQLALARTPRTRTQHAHARAHTHTTRARTCTLTCTHTHMHADINADTNADRHRHIETQRQTQRHRETCT